MSDHGRIDRAIGALGEAAAEPLAPGPAGTPAGSPLPGPPTLGEAERERLADRVAALGPWRQGPFPLAPDVVAGPGCDDDTRWQDLGAALPGDLDGVRVLDVGCGAGFDCFAFAARGAREVLGCEWSGALEQAALIEEVYGTGVSFEATSWEGLDPGRHGTFGLVHCDGVLQRVAAPMNLLGRLWRLTEPGGLLLIGSAFLEAADVSRYVEFGAATDDRADPAWVPGRLALRWMVETSGFDADGWFGERPHAGLDVPAATGYLRARRAERAPAIG
jgi:SAM-dependent methyltransferase